MQASGPTNVLGQEQFMQLLLAQVRHQDALEPLKDQYFMAQLAQFSSLQGIQQLNANFADMLQLQQLTQGANLIGRTITFQQAGSSAVNRGVVDRVTTDNGQIQVHVGTAQV